AHICSLLWLNPLFKIGHKRKLKQDDMFSVLPEDRSQRLGEELQGYWDREVRRAKREAWEPSLTEAIINCYWSSYVVLGIFAFLEEGTRVVQPIFLGKMISYFENYDPSDSAALHEAYGYAAGLSASVLLWAILHHMYFYHIQRVGMRLRVAVCHMIYRKSLRLSSSAMGKTTTGQIVNLLSNDVSRFDQVMMFLHYLWVGPLQVIAVTALLWMEIGMSCLAGMAVLIILLLLQSCFGMLFSSLRSETAALTDDRISTMSEVISGIKAIKMNAWEKSFIDLISTLRRKEISKILKSSYLRGMNLASFFAVSKIMIFVTFITNDLLDNQITASQVFVVVTLFEALRFSSTLYFPMAVEKVSEAIVSIQRIKNFLLLDEIPQLNPQLPSDGETIVDVDDFTASWDKESGTPALQNLFFTARPGELLAVVGPVGAGKSSLLRAVLGELPPSQGQVSVNGRIAYVSQQPWVFSGTVRSNILFGKKYEEDRYEEVIKACALGETFTECLVEEGVVSLYSVLKSRDITLLTKVHLVKAMVFPPSWSTKESKMQYLDASIGVQRVEKSKSPKKKGSKRKKSKEKSPKKSPKEKSPKSKKRGKQIGESWTWLCHLPAITLNTSCYLPEVFASVSFLIKWWRVTNSKLSIPVLFPFMECFPIL
ncbi:hypothetical protein FD754_023012, partial [Muntiacus muntjak]